MNSGFRITLKSLVFESHFHRASRYIIKDEFSRLPNSINLYGNCRRCSPSDLALSKRPRSRLPRYFGQSRLYTIPSWQPCRADAIPTLKRFPRMRLLLWPRRNLPHSIFYNASTHAWKPSQECFNPFPLWTSNTWLFYQTSAKLKRIATKLPVAFAS